MRSSSSSASSAATSPESSSELEISRRRWASRRAASSGTVDKQDASGSSNQQPMSYMRAHTRPKRATSVPSTHVPSIAAALVGDLHPQPRNNRRVAQSNRTSSFPRIQPPKWESLLKTTLIINTRSSKTRATTPSLTPRTSLSSLTSSLSSPTMSETIVQHPTLHLAAPPTTFISASNNDSLAQFSPTPTASESLAYFGVPRSRSPSRQRSTSRTRPQTPLIIPHDDYQGPEWTWKNTFGAFTAKHQKIPSISRTHTPDTDEEFAPMQTSPFGRSNRGTTKTRKSMFTLGDEHVVDSPVDEEHHVTNGKLSPVIHFDTAAMEKPPALVSAPRPIRPSPLTKSLSMDGHTPPSSNNAWLSVHQPMANRSQHARSRTLGYGIVRPSSASPEPPTLDAVESASRLMMSKVFCANCKRTGAGFPRCPRCGEAWCSRDCRVVANGGGKHVCPSSRN